jgi:hypothetical protein
MTTCIQERDAHPSASPLILTSPSPTNRQEAVSIFLSFVRQKNITYISSLL